MREVKFVIFTEESNDRFLGFVWWDMEVTWHFMHFNFTLQLTTFLFFHLRTGCVKDDILVSLVRFLSKSIGNALSYSIDVERVFVKTTFNILEMCSCNVNDIESGDGTRWFRECYVDIQCVLYWHVSKIIWCVLSYIDILFGSINKHFGTLLVWHVLANLIEDESP